MDAAGVLDERYDEMDDIATDLAGAIRPASDVLAAKMSGTPVERSRPPSTAMPAALGQSKTGRDPDANHHEIGIEDSAVVELRGALVHLVDLSADVPIHAVVR